MDVLHADNNVNIYIHEDFHLNLYLANNQAHIFTNRYNTLLCLVYQQCQ